MPKITHRFGGAWTELKLEAVRYYLEFYAGALKGQPFDLWYIDAFAGTGDRAEQREAGGIFEQTHVRIEDVVLDGSAKRAMAVQPPFKHLLFMEDDPARFQALCGLKDEDRSLGFRPLRRERDTGRVLFADSLIGC